MAEANPEPNPNNELQLMDVDEHVVPGNPPAVNNAPLRLLTEVTFSGATNDRSVCADAEEFLQANLAHKNLVPDETAYIQRLVGNLQGQARTWWHSLHKLSSSKKHVDATRILTEYDYFKRQFLRRFKPTAAAALLTTDTHDITQGNQTLSDYLENSLIAIHAQSKKQVVSELFTNKVQGFDFDVYFNLARTNGGKFNYEAADQALLQDILNTAGAPVAMGVEKVRFMKLVHAATDALLATVADAFTFSRITGTWYRGVKDPRIKTFINNERAKVRTDIVVLMEKIRDYEISLGGPPATLTDRNKLLRHQGYNVASADLVADFKELVADSPDEAAAAVAAIRRKGQPTKKGKSSGPPRSAGPSTAPSRTRTPSDPAKFCLTCQIKGHDLSSCRRTAAAKAAGKPNPGPVTRRRTQNTSSVDGGHTDRQSTQGDQDDRYAQDFSAAMSCSAVHQGNC